MKSPNDPAHSEAVLPEPADSGNSGATGLPVLRTWRAVYIFVLATFALWVGLLIALSRMFS